MTEDTGVLGSEDAAHAGGPPVTIELVVAGYDGSGESTTAVRWAAELAARTGARLRVVWVWRMADVWEEAMTGRHDAAIPPIHELEKLARRRLTAVVDALAGDLVSDVDLHLDHDPEPARAVLRAAEGADMLVLGSRGRGRVASAVLGSVSVRCLREATCPVLVIPHRMVPTPAPRLDAGHRGAPRAADDTPAATVPRAAALGD